MQHGECRAIGDVEFLSKCEARGVRHTAMSLNTVAAGFPSPADDYLDQPLDFNELLVKRPAATFAVRVTGESMRDAGIFSGDIAVVDRGEIAQDGRVILAIIDGEFTIKRYRLKGTRAWLEAANPAFQPIMLNEARDFEVWGMVRHSIRML
jgi:DNA polymerase V